MHFKTFRTSTIYMIRPMRQRVCSFQLKYSMMHSMGGITVLLVQSSCYSLYGVHSFLAGFPSLPARQEWSVSILLSFVMLHHPKSFGYSVHRCITRAPRLSSGICIVKRQGHPIFVDMAKSASKAQSLI